MPRDARKKSVTGVYHVILRGNNKQIVFAERSDFTYFLDVLEEAKQQDEFSLYAYCLMHNHVHLLMREGKVPLADTLKWVQTKFVGWYNYKYDRCGVLFQGRYKSEPVNDKEYFLTVCRYIMQNPLHAGLEKVIGSDYPWSSCGAYRVNGPRRTEADCYAAALTDTEAVMAYAESKDDLWDFLSAENRECCMEHYSMCAITDEEAMRLIYRLTGVKSHTEFVRLGITDRKQKIEALKAAGFSMKQICRYTGLSERMIR